ncbi:winged helix-turn-helix domain-containing protein [Uliginosibacterium gangwonense]|uniref:winged helix-turn-helix domain-containing protein n=1 Tax=Uliginosibacterium gangwonense TaxID=392736 RepID=UPI003CCBA804
MSIRGVGSHLKHSGSTPRKPIKRACKQHPEAVQKWLTAAYPTVEQRPSVPHPPWATKHPLLEALSDIGAKGLHSRGLRPLAELIA